MKICVTATEEGLSAQVDPRFGRCAYFTIGDPETMEFESIPNENISASGGVGIQSAQFVANKGVKVVLTGNIGPNAFNVLKAAGIKVITGVSGKLKDAVEAYRSGKLKPTEEVPTVSAHFGMSGGKTTGISQVKKVMKSKQTVNRKQMPENRR
jgi:predicted Fe-Mo cluster-binding NifX family protein